MLLSPALLALALLPAPTEAGCLVDTERDARWAAAPLVVQGTVTSIELRWEDDLAYPTVYERVQVESTFKGAVTQGGLLLRTGLPSGLCPSAVVFPLGTQVYVVGAPDAEGVVTVGSCTDDVGQTAALEDDLRQIAAQRPQTAAVFPGVSPRPSAPLVLGQLPPPTPALPLRAWVRPVADGAVYAAALDDLPAEPMATAVVALDSGLDVALVLPPSAFLPILAEPWPVAPESGLRWRAGVPVSPALEPPETVVRLAWRPAPPAPPPRGRPRGLLRAGTQALYAAPSGAVLTAISLEQPKTVWLLESTPGWRHIWLQTDTLEGEAWIPEAAYLLPEDGSWIGVIEGGIVRNADPLELSLPAGAEIRQPGEGAVFARARRTTRVWWLATDADRAWVVVETPLGPQVGEVACVTDPSTYRTRCTAEAP